MNAVIHHPGRALALGLAITIALLALLPGSWGDALAQTAGAPTTTATPTSTSVAAGAAATVAPAPNKTIRIPAGAINEAATITSQPILDNDSGQAIAVAEVFASINVPTPDEVEDGGSVVISVFSLDALDADGNEVTFDEPVEMDFEISPEVLAAAGGDASNVVLQFFDEDSGEWTPVSCTGSGTTVTCSLPHFSIWALTVRTQAAGQAGTPATTPSPANTGMGDAGTDSGATNTVAILLGAVALAGVVGVGGRFAVRRRSA